MKNKLTKILAVVMAVFMAVVCVPVMDFDADIFTIEASAARTGSGSLGGKVKWTYNVDKQTLTISGSGAMSNYSSTPSDFTKLIWGYKAYNRVTKIVINNGVTNIGNNVFKDFKKVTSVTIPSSVKTIGNYAFSGCTSLSGINIPSSVTSIGTYAFNGCTALSSVNIPSKVTSISSYTFNGCTSLASINIPSTVKSIGSYAFNGCTKLASIEIPSSITSLSNYVFNGCTSLATVTLNSGLKTIGEGTFKSCTKLTGITIPNTVTSLGKSAFEGCSSLNSVKLSEGLTSIGAYCFKNTKFASVSLPYSVKSIGANAFAGISGLKFFCNYGDPAYSYCKTYSASYAYRTPEIKLVPTIDASNKQLKVVVKIKNASGFNAANLNLTYDSTVTPVSTINVDTATDELSTTVAYGSTGNISIAAMSSSCIPYAKCAGECEYTVAELVFKINGKNDSATISLASKIFMSNDVKVAVSTISEKINLHAYTSSTVTKIPNCRETGVRTYTCTVCGKNVTEDIEKDATNHASYGTQVKNAVKENCGVAGYTGDTYCKGCNVKTASGTVTPATGKHSHSSKVTKPATCIAEGEKTFTCTVCGDTYTEEIVINANNHTGNVETRNAKSATCGADGYTGDTHCKDCGVKTKTGTVVKATGNHKTEIRNAKPATCGADGYTGDTYCTVCKKTIKTGTVIKATGNHKTELRNAKPATCGADGYTGDTYCTVCKKTIKTGTVVKATGNHKTEIRNAKAATCTTAGYTGDTYCTVCGTKTATGKTIAATGKHTYDAGTVTKAPTCCDTGTKTYTCTVCKGTKTETVAINSSNHTGGTEIKDAISATCTTAGYTGNTYCKGCGAKIADGTATDVDSTNHSHSAEVIAPTCTQAGYTVYTCECGDTYTADEVDATGHHFDENGKCSDCDEVRITEIKFVAESGLTVSEVTDESTQEVLKFVISKNTTTAAQLLSFIEGDGWSISDAESNSVENDTAVATSYILRHTTGMEYTVIILGDVNFDGQITAADARQTLRTSAALQTFTAIQTFAGDVTFDNEITASDARKILRVSAGIDEFK